MAQSDHTGCRQKNNCCQSSVNIYYFNMSLVKEKIKDIVDSQPEDATQEEILREIYIAGVINRGIEGSENNNVVSNEEILEQIKRK